VTGTWHLILVCAFWAAMVLMLYTYVGYPTWMYFCSRLRPRRWRQATITPRVSVILAVYNGAALLRQRIDQLLSLEYPRDLMEIIVVSDGSTDDTSNILKSFRYPIVKSILFSERRGKAAAVNCGIEQAKGDILLFVDIRPQLDPSALSLLLSNFADPDVGCATGQLVLRDDGEDQGAKSVGGLYWRYEQWIRKCESQVDSPLGVFGGFYAIRRELARALPEATILDDMLQPLGIVRQGYRSIVDGRARVYDVWPKTLKDEFARKVRTLAGNFQLLQLAPWLLSRDNRLRFELISHKLLRLFVPLLLAVLVGASALLAPRSRAYAVILVVQLFLYAIAAFGPGRQVPILARITGAARAFCMMNLAVVIGFQKFLFTQGPLWKIWIPSANFQTATPVEQDKAAKAAGARA
jgi:cellulose synthase/poly-beta-1,6-N-acetylglucosamine synthase-like glycosyltransferase